MRGKPLQNSTHPALSFQFDRSPLVIVFSGASGSGKDSVLNAVVARMEENQCPIHFVVTATTRPRRDDEVDGKDYIFVSEAQFRQMIARDELIEYALVYGQYKGVPKQQIREALASQKDVAMRLDVQGAAAIRRLFPDAVLIFIATSSEQELRERLKRRHTESPQQLQLRLEMALEEMKHIPEFDYVIPNRENRLAETVDIVLQIITAEKHRVRPRRAVE
jgi:guanylate kinase